MFCCALVEPVLGAVLAEDLVVGEVFLVILRSSSDDWAGAGAGQR